VNSQSKVFTPENSRPNNPLMSTDTPGDETDRTERGNLPLRSKLQNKQRRLPEGGPGGLRAALTIIGYEYNVY